jgi:hypothetical protein
MSWLGANEAFVGIAAVLAFAAYGLFAFIHARSSVPNDWQLWVSGERHTK